MIVSDESIKVYDRKVQIEEIIPLIIKRKRCKKHLPNLEISWTAISDHMKSRSYDDIRNHWSLKLLPLLLPIDVKSEWTQEQDISLLEQIYEQDIQD